MEQDPHAVPAYELDLMGPICPVLMEFHGLNKETSSIDYSSIDYESAKFRPYHCQEGSCKILRSKTGQCFGLVIFVTSYKERKIPVIWQEEGPKQKLKLGRITRLKNFKLNITQNSRIQEHAADRQITVQLVLSASEAVTASKYLTPGLASLLVDLVVVDNEDDDVAFTKDDIFVTVKDQDHPTTTKWGRMLVNRIFSPLPINPRQAQIFINAKSKQGYTVTPGMVIGKAVLLKEDIDLAQVQMAAKLTNSAIQGIVSDFVL